MQTDIHKEPVSVVVTTYNSAHFVLETLESVKAQSWKTIELIISDDCSRDNTVELCNKWINDNGAQFVRTLIITVPINTGVSANCNRCIKASSANWIKMIAGDDILLPNCIEDNMRFISANKEAAVVFSQVLLYQDEFTADKLIASLPDQFPMNFMNPAFGAAEQYKLLLLSDRISYTPSYFFKKEVIIERGGYDEENKLLEDYPMWLKLTQSGQRLYYFHKPTVGYRRHQQALNNITEYGLFKPQLLKLEPIRKKLVYPYLPWDIAGKEKFIAMVSILFQNWGMNKKTSIFTSLYKITTVYLNPYQYIISFKKHVMKLGRNNIFYAD